MTALCTDSLIALALDSINRNYLQVKIYNLKIDLRLFKCSVRTVLKHYLKIHTEQKWGSDPSVFYFT